MPNRSKGRGQTKSDPTGPPGWGLGRGLITLSRIKKSYYRNHSPTCTMRIHEARRGKVKMSELEDITHNYDKKRFPYCLKSIDYSVKQNVTQEISNQTPKTG